MLINTKTLYLTILEGLVIEHTMSRPGVVGRFQTDTDAEMTLLEAGWNKRGTRFFSYVD